MLKWLIKLFCKHEYKKEVKNEYWGSIDGSTGYPKKISNTTSVMMPMCIRCGKKK